MRAWPRNSRTEQAAEPIAAKPVVSPTVSLKKPRTDGIISIVVSLPNGDVKARFVKRNVLSNVSMAQVTKANLERAFRAALEPIFGGVEAIQEEKQEDAPI